MRKLFISLLFTALYFTTFGVYVENSPHKLVQPDGEVLNVFITGDEFFRRVHDSEGYSIVKRTDGWFCYADYDAAKDILIETDYIVSSTKNVELPMPKWLGISKEKYLEIRRAYYEPAGFDISGARKDPNFNQKLNNRKSTQPLNNIVICIGFADTDEMTHPFTYVDGMFNSTPGNNMREYFSTMSYGKIDVESHFYPPADGTILRFYKDIYPRSYFEGIYNGHPDRTEMEHQLLKRAVEWVDQYHPIPEDIDLDTIDEGYCDFISFVIYGPVGEWADLLWPHKWALYSDYATLNGKRVWVYNFELDGTESYFNVSVLSHEGYHVLNAPDLYHYATEFRNDRAVGIWDLMDNSTRPKPQSMTAYMKHKYGNWISELPLAKINTTYEIFSYYLNDGSDPDKPVIYKIPMSLSQNQFSVVEYRKKTDLNYEEGLPSEGLVIYRINSGFSGNAQFDGYYTYDEVFLYRPGSTQTGGTYTTGNINDAPFNPTNGRTEFSNNTDPKPLYSEGVTDNVQNINNIQYDSNTDSYTFFYGKLENSIFTIDKEKLVLGILAGSKDSLTITSNVLWNVVIPEEAKTWLSVSKTKGLKSEKLIFTASTFGTDRKADVAITGNGGTFIVKVSQGTVNINENCSVDFELYPNPATSSFHISMPYEKLKIYNTIGELVKTSGYERDVDVSMLSDGVYIVVIESNNKLVKRQLVIRNE